MKILTILVFIAIHIVELQASDTEKNLQIFGQFRASVNAIDDGICASVMGCGEDTSQHGLSFRNNASVLGIKGSAREGNTEAFFKYILRSHNDAVFSQGALQTIIYEAGLSGDFGRVSYGVGSTPYKMSGMKLDPFWDTSASARGFDGPGIGLSDLTWGFTKNLIKWDSVALLGVGFRVQAAVILDDDNANEHDVNVGMSWSGDNWSGGVQYLAVNESVVTAKAPGTGEFLRLWASGLVNNIRFSFSTESGRFKDSRRDSEQHYYASADWAWSQKVRLAFSAGQSETLAPHLNGKGLNAGVFYRLLDDTDVYVLASRIQRRGRTPQRQITAIGVNHRFGWAFE